MRKLGFTAALVLIIAACGGGEDSSNDTVDDSAGTVAASSSDVPDPCTLADDTILTTYFSGSAPEPERTEAGPIDGCSWRDANANSLLIQVAADYDLFRPDPCDGCTKPAFGDDGYAWDSPLQSGASVVDGSSWFSVTTTGFGDGQEEVTALLEAVYQNATG